MTAQVPFSIVLNDCDPKVSGHRCRGFRQADTPTPQFAGCPSGDNKALPATGVGIEILTQHLLTAEAGRRDLRRSRRWLKAPIRTPRATHAIRQPPPRRRQCHATFIMKYE